jgi:hypothetical protein
VWRNAARLRTSQAVCAESENRAALRPSAVRSSFRERQKSPPDSRVEKEEMQTKVSAVQCGKRLPCRGVSALKRSPFPPAPCCYQEVMQSFSGFR